MYPDSAIEALQRRDGVTAGENKVVDACGAPCTLEFAGPARERNALHARSLERFREGFRLFGIGLVGPAQADSSAPLVLSRATASSPVAASPS